MTLESLFAIGALAAVFGLLAMKFRRRGFRVALLAVTAIWLVASATLGRMGYRDRQEANLPTPPPDRPQEVARPGYITSDSCKSCHPSQYDTWHGSYHRKMTQVASPETVIGDFDDKVFEAKGHSYRLFRKGEEFWVEMDRIEFGALKPSKPERIERHIIQTTGSHHMQIYWFASGTTRILEQLPIIWLKPEQRWTPRNACFLMPPNAPVSTEPGRWNVTCVACHTTRGRPQMNSPQEMYTETTEFGIACEACHGPAENHVAINGNPARRYKQWLADDDDDSIVNPVQLPARLDSQVCGQCHGLRRPRTDEDERAYTREGVPFQPGQDLEKVMLVATIRHTNEIRKLEKTEPDFVRSRFWSDGMIRISGREYNGLIESPCFKDGTDDRRMSCFSCHAMHQPASDARSLEEWADDQLKPGMRTDKACLQCHADYENDIPAHTRHLAGSSGSKCSNCHMPHTTYGLLKAIRSHQVSVPSAQESIETGRPNACNLCHLDKTLAWTADHLHEWFGAEKPQLTEDQKSIAVSALWLLKGDAGQRALTAWSMGWSPAQDASGTEWLPPFLGQALLDPYDAVRFIAWRSLRTQSGYDELSFDYVAPIEDRFAIAQDIRKRWQSSHSQLTDATKPTLLITGPGRVNNAEFRRLIDRRDNSPINLAE
jgi:hypothetical protein